MLPLFRSGILSRGISEGAADIIMQSWRYGTQKQYRTYLQRWHIFCDSRKINPVCATIENGIEFLFNEYKKGLSYSAINTVRSALSTVIILPEGSFGSHPLVSRFLKGVFQARPSFPRYQSTWNVSDVLSYLRTMGPAENLKLPDLSLKTVMSVTLLSGQRCQTVHALTLSGMKQTDNHIIFELNTLLKTSRPGKYIKQLSFKYYPDDKLLCVMTCLKQYLQKTNQVRDGNGKLWLSFNKPHKPVTKDTIARWIKTVLGKAGIDTSSYTAHSTRAASTSAVSSANLPIDIIMKAAGWSSENTFQKFYNKPLVNSQNIGEQLLLLHSDVTK